MAEPISSMLMLLQLASMAKGLWDAFRPPQPPQMPEPPPTLSWDEAQRRATEVYNPLFQEQMTQTLENLAKQQIARGVYGQQPADAMAQRAAADVATRRAAAIGQLANQLVGQSEQNALQQQQLAMQYAMNNWNTQLANQVARTNALLNAGQGALNTWATIANTTGYLPQLPWQRGSYQPTQQTQMNAALRAVMSALQSGPVGGFGGAPGGSTSDPLAAGLMRGLSDYQLSSDRSLANPFGR